MNTRLLLTIIAVLSSLSSVPAALAGDAPGQAAFDACNRLARETVKTPSASPPTMAGSHQGPVLGRPAAPSAQAAESGASAIAGTSPQTTTGPLLGRPAPDPSGVDATAPDPFLSGMAAAGQGDPAYQRAYSECMRSKLWSGT